MTKKQTRSPLQRASQISQLSTQKRYRRSNPLPESVLPAVARSDFNERILINRYDSQQRDWSDLMERANSITVSRCVSLMSLSRKNARSDAFGQSKISGEVPYWL